jgi:mRNA interferase MazF
MNQLARGMVIVVRLDPVEGSETGKERPCIIVTNDFYNHRVPVIQVVPVTSWNERKEAIITNVVIDPDGSNGLSKRSVADCLQTRPIDWRKRMVRVLGSIEPSTMHRIDIALRTVFELDRSYPQ